MELFESIRREYFDGVGTILGVAKKLGVHRRLVREAIQNAAPPPRKKTQPQPSRLLSEVVLFIHQVLAQDRRAPAKQRHTAQRIWERLREELPQHPVSPRSVRRQVELWRQQHDTVRAETYISQHYEPGVEAQADWYEAWAELGGARVKLQVFCLRSMYSGAAFHRAYWRATQGAFLDAHIHAFAWFGGVFRTLRYDNLKAAVKQILRGKRREETTRFIAFRSHYLFAAEFCNPARGNEKGGVEQEVGRFRRRWWTPVPRCTDLDQLNVFLMECCSKDRERHIDGRSENVAERFGGEQGQLRSQPGEAFDLTERLVVTVDAEACVRVKTNRYSTPLRPGTLVEAWVDASHVEVRHNGSCVARHERCYSVRQEVLRLEHYLGVLERKPGALAHSKALAQYRQAGLWPESFDQLWRGLIQRQGQAGGTREMIGLLRLLETHSPQALRAAVEQALECGSSDAATVRHLLMPAIRTEHREAPLSGMGPGYERPLPALDIYDQLLGRRVTQ